MDNQQNNNDKLFKQVQLQLDALQIKFKNQMTLSVYALFLILIIVFRITVTFTQTEHWGDFYHQNEASILSLAIVSISIFLTTALISLLLKVKICKEFGVVEVSGYLKSETITRYAYGPMHEQLIYLSNVVSSETIPSNLIYYQQYAAINETLLQYGSNQRYTFKAIILKPTPAMAITNKYHRSGYLALLPYENYIKENRYADLAESENKSWLAASESGHQPTFIEPRKEIEIPLNNNLVCEDNLRSASNKINFHTEEPIKKLMATVDTSDSGEQMYFPRAEEFSVSNKFYFTYIYCLISSYIFLPSYLDTNIYFDFSFLPYSSINLFEIYVSTLILGGLHFLYLTFKPMKLGIMLDRKKQQISINKEGVLYTVPWSNCDMSVIATQYKKKKFKRKKYMLKLWLDSIHDDSGKIIPATSVTLISSITARRFMVNNNTPQIGGTGASFNDSPQKIDSRLSFPALKLLKFILTDPLTLITYIIKPNIMRHDIFYKRK